MGRVGGTRPARRRTVGPARLSTSSRPRCQSTSSRAVQRPLSRATPSAAPPRQIPSQRQTATASRRRKGPREIPAPAAERPSRPRPPRNGPSPRGVRAAPRRPRRPIARHERAGAGPGPGKGRPTHVEPRQVDDRSAEAAVRPDHGEHDETHSGQEDEHGPQQIDPAIGRLTEDPGGQDGVPPRPRGRGRAEAPTRSGRPRATAAVAHSHPPWPQPHRGPGGGGGPIRTGSPGKPRLAGGTARATRTGPSERARPPGLPPSVEDAVISFWFIFKVQPPPSPPDRP